MSQSKNLVEETRRMLNEQYPVGTMIPIRKATGLDERWLYKFRKGEIGEPLTTNTQKLYEALTGEPLLS